MAYWKESGEVPDSEDEEELESVNSTVEETWINNEQFHQTSQLDEDTHIYKADGRSDTVREKESFDGGSNGLEQWQSKAGDENADQNNSRLHSQTAPHRSIPSQSPFNFSALWFEGIRGQRDSRASGEPPADEFSPSYVRITAESLPPSPSGSLQKLSLPPVDHAAERIAGAQDTVDVVMSIDSSPPTVVPKRAFRQRKQIQLHPYGIERQKYQRTLKERGIAPILIAPSQEERRPALEASFTSSPIESQLLESNTVDSDVSSDEGFLVNGNSRMIDGSLEISLPPQSPHGKLFQSQDLDELINQYVDNSDEEFPDIDELLKQDPGPPLAASNWQRKRYSNRSEMMRSATSHTTAASSSRDQRGFSVFDVPASPPTTSSPAAVLRQRTMSRSASAASKAEISIVIPPVRHLNQNETSIPTPVTSSAKRSSAIYVDSESEVELGLSAIEDHQPSASSSDESIEMKRVGKKIRGVLPASHLRLDQHQQTRPRFTARQFDRSPSPVIRRGVALPAVLRSGQMPSGRSGAGISFLQDLSDDEDNESVGIDTNTESHNSHSAADIMFLQSKLGFAEEEDHIDPMLPSSRKHRLPTPGNRPKKKRRTGFQRHEVRHSPKRQPRITELLDDVSVSISRNKNQLMSKIQTQKQKGRKGSRRDGPAQKQKAPRLSILDVNDLNNSETLPMFIRVAARTARSRRNLGRQSPTSKYIRLANREDTIDAQAVLQEWRDIKLQPKDLEQFRSRDSTRSTSELHQIDDNQQSRRLPTIKMRGIFDLRPSLPRTTASRKLVISKRLQHNIDKHFPRQVISLQAKSTDLSHRNDQSKGKGKSTNLRHNSSARPAQLEAHDFTPALRPSFRSSKSVLDALYKANSTRTSKKLKVPMIRFLNDDDFQSRPIESRVRSGSFECNSTPSQLEIPERGAWRKKRPPQRLDVDASMYRQPSNPMVLDLSATTSEVNSGQNKLTGLGKYGTNYTVNFDILPLPPGVFFDKSTFIGGGRLAQALIVDDTQHYESVLTLQLGNKSFTWTQWNDVVSSELGICFDWILDQVDNKGSIEAATEILDKLLLHVQTRWNLGLKMQPLFVRLVEILQDFSESITSRSAAAKLGLDQLGVIRSTSLLCLRCLLLARYNSDTSQQAFQLEALLVNFARPYIRILMGRPLDDVRKLYDKVQYLSFRQRGIPNDEVMTEAWVIIMKIMGTAEIQRGSFWDLVNAELLGPGAKSIDDAPSLENMWYFMFSLLPLSEFDNWGIVMSGCRFGGAFENWILPQHMFKSVFGLYALNQKQPATFNDYCRALFHRCHYLVTEWGWWKCNAIIGTMFDFFASHNLSHLRNEEVYASPSFLQQLHLNPSLGVEPEDRSFHIFLKITALGIRHFEKAGNDKSVRNLVARLLPNHDRQYLKEEEIHQRDLASLRNHHDLLCVLFWAAPTRHRPSPTLLQKLVVLEHSHTQACLINIRAWENLTRFVLAMSPTDELFKPLSTWQRSALDALWNQYYNAEIEVRHQADELSTEAVTTITEAQIRETAKSNRGATKPIIGTMLQAMSNSRNLNMPLGVAKMLFHVDFLAQILENRPVEDFSVDVIDALAYYIKLIGRPSASSDTDESQESQFGLEVLNRFEAISELADFVVPPFQRHLQSALEANPTNNFRKESVICWTSLVYLLSTEEIQGYELSKFVGTGRYALFNHTGVRSPAQESFWMMFLSDLLERSTADSRALDDLGTPEFDIGSEWLRVLVQPASSEQMRLATDLSVQLHELGYCLLRLPVGADGVILPGSGHDIELKDSNIVRNLEPRGILRWALSSMKCIVQGVATARPINLSRAAAKDNFSWQLQYIMRSMQERLQRMEQNSKQHKQYVSQVQNICDTIQVYCSTIRPLENFFQHIGNHYWPPQSDPHRFAPFAKSFALDLGGENPHKAARSLFYFLLNSFDQSLTKAALQSHRRNLKRAMAEPAFLKFALDELIAPMIEMGFGVRAVPGGWLFCLTYLPVVGGLLYDYLQNNTAARLALNDQDAGATVYQWAIKAADTIMFYVQLHQNSYKNVDTGLFDARYQEILAISFDFWHTILPGLLRYQSEGNECTDFIALKSAFENVALNVKKIMQSRVSEPRQRLLTSTTKFRGTFYEEFRHGLETYVLENWTAGRGDGSIMLNKSGRKVEFGPSDGSPLAEVGPNSVGIGRPDLMRAIVHLNQKMLNAHVDSRVHDLLATFV